MIHISMNFSLTKNEKPFTKNVMPENHDIQMGSFVSQP